MVTFSTVHALFIVWGYAVEAQTDPLTESKTLLLTYPGVLSATVALGLFLLVGAMSARAARRRLRYETWHFVHFYTYLAIALAFSHQLTAGAEFVAFPEMRYSWWALYVGVGVLVLWYPMARASSLDPATRPAGDVGPRRTAGGRLRWCCAGGTSTNWAPSRASSSGGASSPAAALVDGQPVLALGRTPPPHAAHHGRGGRRPQRISLAAPTGNPRARRGTVRSPWERRPSGADPCCFSRVAWASHRCARCSRRCLRRPAGSRCSTGPAPESDLLFTDELDEIAVRRGAEIVWMVGPSSAPALRLTGATLRRLVPDVAERDVYLCASPGLSAAVRTALREAGLPRRRLHEEAFAF